MLEWIWFVVLTLAAMAFSLFLSRRELLDEVKDEITLNIIPPWLILVAAWVSWPVLGQKIFNVLDQSIPQNGTVLHLMTVWVLMLLLLFVYSAVVLLLPCFFVKETDPLGKK